MSKVKKFEKVVEGESLINLIVRGLICSLFIAFSFSIRGYLAGIITGLCISWLLFDWLTFFIGRKVYWREIK